MNRTLDFLRLTFISPELLAALLPVGAYAHSPDWAYSLLKPMSDGIGWGLTAGGICFGMLAFNYKECFELLSLSGGKKVLIEWPGYPTLKTRVIAALVWCVCGALVCLGATWMVAENLEPQLGATLLVGGLLAPAVATVTIGLARFRLRELLGE